MHNFLETRLLAEGFFEFGSAVRPSVLPSVQKFSWNWSISPSVCLSFNLSERFFGFSPLVFSETQHNVRGSSRVVLDRVRFSGENSLWAKSTKNGCWDFFVELGH